MLDKDLHSEEYQYQATEDPYPGFEEHAQLLAKIVPNKGQQKRDCADDDCRTDNSDI